MPVTAHGLIDVSSLVGLSVFMGGWKMKAYVLSTEHGTVQIGSIVYQPCTGAMFVADRKGLKGKKIYTVEKASMEVAKKILQEVGR